MRGSLVRSLGQMLLVVAATACVDAPRPETQLVVFVDTDLPAALATRLRIDLFTDEGVWFETREVVRVSARDWPASFGVVANGMRDVLMRARVYPEGHTRDYRGERFAPFGGIALDEAPSLELTDGARPTFEPHPDVAVDRLVRLSFTAGEKNAVRIVLHGACAGTMSKVSVSGSVLDASSSRSCIGEKALLSDLAPPERGAPGTSMVGSWMNEPCGDQQRSTSGRVCVPGGAFVFGNAHEQLGSEFEPRERIVGMRRFFIDRNEVAIADFRAALDRGFAPPEPVRENDGPLVADPIDGCAFTKEVRDREALPLSCATWATAAAYCAFVGGSLPTEAQWEYVASAAGRSAKSTFPWGDDDPTCERASYGRAYVDPAPGACQSAGSGPQAIGVPAVDRTALGVASLGGGVSEWMQDTPMPLTADCWIGAPIADPRCNVPSDRRSVRGGAWSAPPPFSRSALRRSLDAKMRHASVGFRCVYGAP